MYWFVYRQNGTLAEWQQNETTEWTNAQYYSTDAVGHIGPIANGDATAQDAFMKPSEYTVQNGQLVHSNPPSAQAQLDAAKQTRLAYLQQSFGQALERGFPSSADGTARTYAIDATAMPKWNGTLALINGGEITANISVKDINGSRVTLTPTQYKQFATDGFSYFNNQEQNLWAKEDNVNAVQLTNYATTQDAINAVNAVTY